MDEFFRQLQTFTPLKTSFEVFVFLMGACVGSFLNVCIHRMPQEQSIVTPGSRCGSCSQPIRWWDNIPLISYFVLRGRCRACGARFSPRYVLVEALTAVLFLIIWKKFGWTNPPLTVAYLLFAGGCIAASFIDWEHYIIPDSITIGGTVIGFFYSLLCYSLQQSNTMTTAATASALGIIVGSGMILWIGIIGEAMFQKEAMGFGDVKLMGAVGAFLGWHGALFSIGLGCMLGAAVGLVLWAVRAAKQRGQFEQRYWDDAELHYIAAGGQDHRTIPFGPFLLLGAMFWVLAPEPWQLRVWMTEMTGTFYCYPQAFPCVGF